MRHFDFYLFENFDADAESANPLNPRRFLTDTVAPILSQIAHAPTRIYSVPDLDRRLLEGGILREENGFLLFDTPIFLREDAPVLLESMSQKASRLADLLRPVFPQLRQCCDHLENGFSAEINLYHLLCGKVFDGLFFDYLQENGALATSRPHPSGLDYLSVIYEQCPELDTLSNGLLCSYNRFTDGETSLQSFGDANGDRFDFYRVSRLLESGNLPLKFRLPLPLPEKSHILAQTRELILSGACDPDALSLLTTFGYAADGKICVPVYPSSAKEIAMELEHIVETTFGEAFLEALSVLPDVTAARHGVCPKEIANELYHILFGTLNNTLAAQGIVVTPSHIPGQGRYLRCIEL